MIAVSTDIVVSILEQNRVQVEQIIENARAELTDFRNNPTRPIPNGASQPVYVSGIMMDYINFLIVNLNSIVRANPDELSIYKDHFDGIILGETIRREHQIVKNELIRRMGYTRLRENHYPNHFGQTGIKTCVYCNSQLAITVQAKSGKRKARFQVDHFLPKSEYPCFSISYFNLYPSCGPCNGRKSSKPVDFQLYSNDPIKLAKSEFSFRLKPNAVSNYRISGNEQDLAFTFSDKDYDEAFDISGIYETQQDVLEELVLKSIIYNRTYLASLKNNFESLYQQKAPMTKRLFVGNYVEEPEIHKRPLSKFTQDIARQLDLI